jgi:hypothetical protein
MKKLLIMSVCVFLFSCCCEEEKEFKVQDTVKLILDMDGCKVYSFKPNPYSDLHYFTNCRGGVQWAERVGKRTVNVEIPTDSIKQ